MRFLEVESLDGLLEARTDDSRGGKRFALVNPSLITSVLWNEGGNCRICFVGDGCGCLVRGEAKDVVRQIELAMEGKEEEKEPREWWVRKHTSGVYVARETKGEARMELGRGWGPIIHVREVLDES